MSCRLVLPAGPRLARHTSPHITLHSFYCWAWQEKALSSTSPEKHEEEAHVSSKQITSGKYHCHNTFLIPPYVTKTGLLLTPVKLPTFCQNIPHWRTVDGWNTSIKTKHHKYTLPLVRRRAVIPYNSFDLRIDGVGREHYATTHRACRDELTCIERATTTTRQLQMPACATQPPHHRTTSPTPSWTMWHPPTAAIPHTTHIPTSLLARQHVAPSTRSSQHTHQ